MPKPTMCDSDLTAILGEPVARWPIGTIFLCSEEQYKWSPSGRHTRIVKRYWIVIENDWKNSWTKDEHYRINQCTTNGVLMKRATTHTVDGFHASDRFILHKVGTGEIDPADIDRKANKDRNSKIKSLKTTIVRIDREIRTLERERKRACDDLRNMGETY